MTKTRPPMTESARERLEKKIYAIDAMLSQRLEGVELDIGMDRMRESKTRRAQARDVYQKMVRDFR